MRMFNELKETDIQIQDDMKEMVELTDNIIPEEMRAEIPKLQKEVLLVKKTSLGIGKNIYPSDKG